MLDVVVGVKVASELSLPCLHLFIPGFLFWRKISVVSDDALKVGEHLVPVQLHICTVGFLKFDPLAAAVKPTYAGYGMRAASDPVFIFQEVGLFLGCVISCEIPVNAAFPTFDMTAAVQCGVDFILGDEHSRLRYFNHVGGVFPTREAVVLQHIEHTLGIVQAEAHQTVILFISSRKRRQLG